MILTLVVIVIYAYLLGTPIARAVTGSERTEAFLDRQIVSYMKLSRATTELLDIDNKLRAQLLESGVSRDDPTIRDLDANRQAEIALGQFVGLQLTSLHTQRRLAGSDFAATEWAVRGLLLACGLALWGAALAVVLQRRQNNLQSAALGERLDRLQASIDLRDEVRSAPKGEPGLVGALIAVLSRRR